MTTPPQKSCHNCRRRRLRCDRSVPVCNKCLGAGQECLGYGSLYRWTNAVASRGKLAGKNTVAHLQPAPKRKCREAALQPGPRDTTARGRGECITTSLMDPLFQDLDYSSRHYLSYFGTRFCQDLVINGSRQLDSNPFRELIPLSSAHPFLRHIIVGVSALHFYNVVCKSISSCDYSPQRVTDALVDAFQARHKAIKALQAMLEKTRLVGDDVAENDALLATVLFFINFTLIDSGKDGWRPHMEAAAKLIAAKSFNSLCLSTKHLSKPIVAQLAGSRSELELQLDRHVMPRLSEKAVLRDYIASDSLVYHIWGSTIDSLALSNGHTSLCANINAEDIISILKRTEANSYHGCPAELLYLIWSTSRVAYEVSLGGGAPTSQQLDLFAGILKEVEMFDVDSWVAEVYAAIDMLTENNKLEIRFRTHMVASYRAAASLYVLLAAPGLQRHLRNLGAPSTASNDTGLPFIPTTRDFATAIIHELTFIPTTSPLFKFTTWPVFMAGMETRSPDRRAWVTERMRAIWDHCPWGMINSAMEVLTNIWQLRDRTAMSDKAGFDDGDGDSKSWPLQLRTVEIDCLIV